MQLQDTVLIIDFDDVLLDEIRTENAVHVLAKTGRHASQGYRQRDGL
jgi:hypothetical protein